MAHVFGDAYERNREPLTVRYVEDLSYRVGGLIRGLHGREWAADAVGMEFGACCKDLKDALTVVPQSSFWVDPNGVLFLTVGRKQAGNGPAFYDAAVMYCPFCGAAIQSREDLHERLRGQA